VTVGAQVKGCFSSIKSIEATLQLLIEKTKEQEQQKQFEQAMQIVAEVKKDLQQQVIKLTKEEPQYK
jgi:NifU-like protein involved in Fe-S cluster formation